MSNVAVGPLPTSCRPELQGRLMLSAWNRNRAAIRHLSPGLLFQGITNQLH